MEWVGRGFFSLSFHTSFFSIFFSLGFFWDFSKQFSRLFFVRGCCCCWIWFCFRGEWGWGWRLFAANKTFLCYGLNPGFFLHRTGLVSSPKYFTNITSDDYRVTTFLAKGEWTKQQRGPTCHCSPNTDQMLVFANNKLGIVSFQDVWLLRIG